MSVSSLDAVMFYGGPNDGATLRMDPEWDLHTMEIEAPGGVYRWSERFSEALGKSVIVWSELDPTMDISAGGEE